MLVKPLIEISTEIPYFAAICARRRIETTRKQFVESIKNAENSSWPSSKTLCLFRLWSMLFPRSDFRHPVMNPVVLLMCEYLMRCPITLAIRDGANDVSMIQMADVGVGISGQEGRQAVMSSDFAMGQFRFLVPLLLVHGHWNYQRLGYMILYNFYRNAVLVLVLFWYVLYTAFTLTTAINEWSSTLYSIVYSALPTIIVGILDKDLGRSTLLRYPQLYSAGQRNEAYNKKLFMLTMADTLWQSMVIFWPPLFAYWKSTIDVASIGDLWTLAVVIIVNLHLAMDVVRWYWVTHAVIWGSIAATFIAVMIIDSIPKLPGFWAFFHVANTGLFWALLLGIIIAALLPRLVVKFIYQYYFPSDIQISREAEKMRQYQRVAENQQIEMLPVSYHQQTR